MIEIIARVEEFIADKIVKVSMQSAGPGFRGHLHGTGCCPPILSSVIRSQHFHFLDRIQAGIHHQSAGCAIQPGIQHVAAVHLEGVVLDPAAVDRYLTLPTTPTLASSPPGPPV